MKGYVHSFESFGTVDGPGVRYVVFLQGCPLRCIFCHNPDSWCGEGTPYEADEVLSKMTRNLPFYKTGGLTVSGGEPLLQLDFLIELFTLAKKNGIENTQEYFQPYIQDYNRSAVPYKKIGLLKVRSEDFPKNTLRKIMRFKIDKTID